MGEGIPKGKGFRGDRNSRYLGAVTVGPSKDGEPKADKGDTRTTRSADTVKLAERASCWCLLCPLRFRARVETGG